MHDERSTMPWLSCRRCWLFYSDFSCLGHLSDGGKEGKAAACSSFYLIKMLIGDSDALACRLIAD